MIMVVEVDPLHFPGVEPCRVDVTGDSRLSEGAGFYRDPVEFLDASVRDRETPFRPAAAVNEDVTAEVEAAHVARLILAIRVVDLQRQMVVAGRVEVVDEVEAFGHLLIALAPL